MMILLTKRDCLALINLKRSFHFSLRTPTNEKLDHFQFRQIELTDDDEWKPESVDLSQGVDRKISMVDRK
jgi:hypothetical protein